MVKRFRRGISRASRAPGTRGARFNVPRKGRIRFFLGVLALVLAFTLFSGRGPRKPPSLSNIHAGPTAVSQPVTGPAPQPAVHRRPNLFERIGMSVSIKKNPVRAFSHDDVVNLLRKYPPRFRSGCDTVQEENNHYIIHYSINFTVQDCGETLLKRYHPKYGALVAMEPGTGRVLAAVSYTREGELPLGDRLYCRSLFPSASTFKTVIAAGAIEKAHMGPDSTFPLVGRRYTLYKFQLAPNVQFGQDVSLEEAYSLSINPIFGRIGIYALGIAGIKEYMEKFGFNSPVPFDLDNDNPVSQSVIQDSLMCIAEVASGFNRETRMSPLFGALMASSVSEKGQMHVPYCVDSITVMDTATLYRAEQRPWRTPMLESTASQIKYLMTRVVEYGTARHAFTYARHSSCFDNVDYGGKTGSIDVEQLGKVDWFIGFACHVTDPRQRIAVGVVTVHDQFWTVHSGYIGEELFRTYIRGTQTAKKSGRPKEKNDQEKNKNEVSMRMYHD
jgi:cell division protein FtsI/penicillin-binding protein 2